MKKIGLLGFGKIGQYIYEQLHDEVDFAFIYDLQPPAVVGVSHISELAELPAACQGVDLVVECAVADVLRQAAPLVLPQSDLLAFSLTAFADREFAAQVEQLTADYGSKFYLPHGAILGLDGIFAAKEILRSVRITTSKRPQNLGLSNTACEVVFEGSTREACYKFPRNVNVHAAIAVCGLGLDATRSVIISDPCSSGNEHHIEVEAEGCSFKLDVVSVPGSGVTGAYTPVSAVASIRRALSKGGLLTV